MNDDERAVARAALIQNIRVPQLIDDLDGRKYRDLVEEHSRQLDGKLPTSILAHEQMIEPYESEAATQIVAAVLDEATTPSFWSSDAGDVLSRISGDLNDALFPDEAQNAGIFNLFQLVTMRLADRIRLEPGFRDMAFSAPAEVQRSGGSGTITRMIGIAISDYEAQRLSRKHLLLILQDSIDSGNILLEDNEPYVATYVMPLIESGELQTSHYIARTTQPYGPIVSNGSAMCALLMNRRRLIGINILIGGLYVGIAVLAPNPWAMLGAFLLLAVTIRCITLLLLTFTAADEGVGRQAVFVIVFNFVGGLVFAAALVTAMWWLGHVWLAAVKVLVPLVAVVVAYRSMFPLPPVRGAGVATE
ncbi:MAG: hypothetical protein WD226_03450 [Planctomycetota bacterium]